VRSAACGGERRGHQMRMVGSTLLQRRMRMRKVGPMQVGKGINYNYISDT
jgi:hypothetical protein